MTPPRKLPKGPPTAMSATLAQLAGHLDSKGMACQLQGDPQVCVATVETLEDARDGQISFLANPKYEKLLATTRAAAVVVDRQVRSPQDLNLLRVDDPYAAITVLIEHLHGHRRHPKWGLSPAATIAETATLGSNPNIAPHAVIDQHTVIGHDVTIYPGCYVGPNCRLGDGVVLFPNVVLYDHTILGHRVAVHSGTVIGNDGLGYAPVGEGWEKIPQIGYVEIGDDVEIGSNCSIDRATLGQTVIASGTKFSNLIAVGHGAKVGDNCMFVAQVGLAGSVNVGRHVTLAGQVGVAGHLTIGDNAQVAAKAGVMNDIKPNTRVLGQPAMPINEAKRIYAVFIHLPEMRDRVRQLESDIAELRRQLAKDAKAR